MGLVNGEFGPLPAQTAPIIEMPFNIVDPLLILAPDESNDRGKSEAFISRRRHDDAVWIEGNSWKGLFRSRCEFIFRSIELFEFLCESCGPGEPIDDEQQSCLICELFGSVRMRGALEFLASKVDDAVFETLTRTAVDRLSGGAADRKLFTI